MEFLHAIKSRHSEYTLSKDIKISDQALKVFLGDMLNATPSAFNSQSQRMLVLTKENHDQLWAYLIEKMKNIVEGDQYEKTKEKLEGFKAAYGTILFFDDTETTKNLQAKFPLYKENFAKWSIEQNGMLQSNVWVGLKTYDIGGSLQHYNELIEDFVRDVFDVPKAWELRAQMPFGAIETPAKAKDHMALDKRLKFM